MGLLLGSDSYVGLSKGWWSDRNLATDGKVDWEIESGDQDSDGQSDYCLTRLLTPIPDYFNAFRGSLFVDRNPRPSLPYSNSIFWPLLVGTKDDESGRYFDNPPAIAVDWEKGAIYHAGVLGYPAERGYHILSSAPTWQKGQVNDVLWENPLAYYDLAGDEDYWPELLIRLVTPLWLDAIPSRPLAADMLQVEYTWDQNNDDKWDYEVSVAGKRPITETVDLPDLSFRTVPYERPPRLGNRA